MGEVNPHGRGRSARHISGGRKQCQRRFRRFLRLAARFRRACANQPVFTVIWRCRRRPHPGASRQM